jgi:hypothetical protein
METVLFEPDEQRVLAVLPVALWLAPGDVVELEDPPRDARVLSSRLQLRGGEARVLVVLDVPDDREEALRGEQPTEAVLAVEVGSRSPGWAPSSTGTSRPWSATSRTSRRSRPGPEGRRRPAAGGCDLP